MGSAERHLQARRSASSAGGADERRCRSKVAPPARPCAVSAAGILLLDAALRPVYTNAAATAILAYPDKVLTACKWHAVVPHAAPAIAIGPDGASQSAREFMSGRRRYVARTFLLDSPGNAGNRFEPRVLLVLERHCAQPVDITRWSDEFQLTSRERETVICLMKGLTSKEIAAEMAISANTVKCFLKLVMAKVGAQSRTAIVARFLERALDTSLRRVPNSGS